MLFHIKNIIFRLARIIRSILQDNSTISEQEFISQEIHKDLFRLGIRGRIRNIERESIIIYFKSEEDLLAYRLLGLFKEGKVTKYIDLKFKPGFWSWLFRLNYKKFL